MCPAHARGREGGGGDLAGLGPGSAPGHREIKGGTGAVGCGDGDALHPPVVRHLRPPLIHWRHPAPGQVNLAAVTREPLLGQTALQVPARRDRRRCDAVFVMCSSKQQTASYHVVDSRSDSSTAPQPPWLSQVAAECKSSVLRRQLRRRSSTVSRGRHPSAQNSPELATAFRPAGASGSWRRQKVCARTSARAGCLGQFQGRHGEDGKSGTFQSPSTLILLGEMPLHKVLHDMKIMAP